tara:strand:+ start:134 stop:1045 length:912 start_codon:yes stop_codon:yes gene_type:complete
MLKTKRIIAIIVVLLFTVTMGMAQNGYKVSVGKRLLNFHDSTVFVLEIDRAIEKDVLKAWKKAVAERDRNAKTEIKNEQLSVYGVTIPSVDDSAMDIHSTIVQQDNSVKLYSVFIIDGERVDPNGVEGRSVKVRKLLESFGARVYGEVLKRELVEKKERLKELMKERDKNLKAQNKSIKEIQRDTLKIQNHETEIGLLKAELVNTNERYNIQKNELETTMYASEDDEKQAKSEVKDLKKKRKSIEKEIQKHSDAIVDLKAQARDLGYSQKQLIEDIKFLEEKLVTQRNLVKAATDELNTYSKK